MASCLSYKQSITTRLKAVGYIDIAHGTIITDDGEKDILSLLSDFDGINVDFTVAAKDEIDLNIPDTKEKEGE